MKETITFTLSFIGLPESYYRIKTTDSRCWYLNKKAVHKSNICDEMMRISRALDKKGFAVTFQMQLPGTTLKV